MTDYIKEVKRLCFFSVDDIPENISPPVRKTIGAYIEMRRNSLNK
jgi:hypothetical protein